MEQVRSGYHVDLLKMLALFLCAISLPGCAHLDLSRQDLRDRLKMHAGTKWRVETLTGNSSPTLDELNQSLISEVSAGGSEPRVGAAYLAKEFERIYFTNREVFLTATSIVVGPELQEIKMFVIDTGMTCSPDGGVAWRCGEGRRIEVDVTGDEEKCVTQARELEGDADAPSMVGVGRHVFHDKVETFCVRLTFVMSVPGRGRTHGPTDISKDKIFIVVTRPEYQGPIVPGGVVGGPRRVHNY